MPDVGSARAGLSKKAPQRAGMKKPVQTSLRAANVVPRVSAPAVRPNVASTPVRGVGSLGEPKGAAHYQPPTRALLNVPSAGPIPQPRRPGTVPFSGLGRDPVFAAHNTYKLGRTLYEFGQDLGATLRKPVPHVNPSWWDDAVRQVGSTIPTPSGYGTRFAARASNLGRIAGIGGALLEVAQMGGSTPDAMRQRQRQNYQNWARGRSATTLPASAYKWNLGIFPGTR